MSEVSAPQIISAQQISEDMIRLDSPNTLAPTSETTATAPSPEKRERNEVTTATRFQEAETITQVAVLRHSQEISKKKTLTDDERSLQGLQFLLGHKKNTSLQIDEPIPTTEGTPIRLSMEDSKFTAVAKGGMQVQEIQQKIVKDGQVLFVCRVEGNQNLQKVPIDEVIRSQIFAEGDAVLRVMSEDSAQKKIMEDYFASVKKGERELNADNATIQTAASETGLFTSDNVESFIDKSDVRPEIKEVALKLIDGKNITDPETLGTILYNLNDIPGQADAMRTNIAILQTELDTKRAHIAAITDNTEGKTSLEAEAAELQAKIAGQEAQAKILEQLKDAMPTGPDGIIEQLQAAVDGGMSVEQIRKMNKAMKEGKLQELMATLFDQLPKDHPDYEKFKQLQDIAKYAGIGFIAVFVILLMSGMNSRE
jgi:hypothetical protein